ncbi:Queuosine biosynthesis protein QueD [Planctomycetales bacterium 10988]|nr:Queuosine biosynthesis protein QueD [Planctomycetales bacterium 10988]
MPERYSVKVTKDTMVFAAGHFITFNKDQCERLHGHNYRVSAEVEGELDENAYVVDFIALRDILQGLCFSLDHYMLLPDSHPLIRVEAGDKEVEVTFEDRRWVFPRGDCKILPMSNTTTELLAKYLGEQLREQFEEKTGVRLQVIRMTVDENHGQFATCELRED